ncbi:MAG: XRE family transcriptional regulator [Novosphingobium pentaromativorans]|uniref:XRE family transcriptional regulator n=1 Tax=Novosphingobium pentaromativorans TaxID=205844 RepID=A0A2W5NRR3_9SPHN|nr:MAG: XRE family transcriptional regulator [Novosphingobium pentaromativorans]
MIIEHVTSSGNVFADLGLPNPEERLVKSKLAAALQRSMTELGLTQTAASARMGISQPKLSKILRGRFDGISEAYITEGLRKLGHDVEIRVKARHDGIGTLQVRETA